jgi:hypothetical protein
MEGIMSFNRTPMIIPAWMALLASQQNQFLNSPFYRNRNPNRPITVGIAEALGSGVDLTVGGASQVYYTSERHGAPFVRNDKIVNGIVLNPPTSVSTISAMETYVNAFKDSNGKIAVNVLVPALNYNLSTWK